MIPFFLSPWLRVTWNFQEDTLNLCPKCQSVWFIVLTVLHNSVTVDLSSILSLHESNASPQRANAIERRRTKRYLLSQNALKHMCGAVISASSADAKRSSGVPTLTPHKHLTRSRRQCIFKWSQRSVAGQWCKCQSILVRARPDGRKRS